MKSKLPHTPTSIFSVMSQMALTHNAINLSQGFPNFESDPNLIVLVSKAMQQGHNQYAPMPGDMELREQISNKTMQLHAKRYDAAQEVTVTAGATQAIFTALAATVNTGDEVILFAPAYDCYEPTIRLFGGKPIPLQLRPPRYAPQWDEVASKITSRTKMIIINSPHNPTGYVFTKEDMKALEMLAEKHGLLVLSDEVYEHIIFDGREHQSAARFEALASRTFITASFGKTFHNTGWKMGYCLAPQRLMEEFRKVHQYIVFCVNHPVQKALAEYLRTPDHYLSLPSFYQRKRDYFLSLIEGSRFKYEPSEGTYFQLLDFSEITSEGDRQFAERLTKEQGLATIPTSAFNENNEDFKQLRVCFAKTDDTLKRAADILTAL
jgi:methionine aminotransferase